MDSGHPSIVPTGGGHPSIVPTGGGRPSIVPTGGGRPSIVPTGWGRPSIVPTDLAQTATRARGDQAGVSFHVAATVVVAVKMDTRTSTEYYFAVYAVPVRNIILPYARIPVDPRCLSANVTASGGEAIITLCPLSTPALSFPGLSCVPNVSPAWPVSARVPYK